MATEKRLMSIDDFKRNLCHYCNTYMSDEPCEPGECWVYDVIEQTGSVDAVEVVHARWEDMYGGKYANPRYRCSACKEKATYKFKKNGLDQWYEVQALTPYCPNCGARMMDGDGNG